MWGVDDEIRAGVKDAKTALTKYTSSVDETVQKLEDVINKINEMIFKEEIADESGEIGYCLTQPDGKWIPDRINVTKESKPEGIRGTIKLDTGVLTNTEINGILKHLPFDITFIDKDDVVKYFSQGKERIFARTKAVIGRKVQNCHPPASVHIVEKILEDFKSGKKDHEDFWIKMSGLYVYIRYFAVRDANGQYMGTMEVTQNINPIQQIQGEKRLMSE